MRSTSGARRELLSAAAGGRKRRTAISAAAPFAGRSRRLPANGNAARRREAITRRSLVQILPPQPHEESTRPSDGCFLHTITGAVCADVHRVMRPTSAARWEKRGCAAGGGCSSPAFSAAVGISSRALRRRGNSGHRKVGRSQTRRSLVQILPPQPHWYTGYDTIACVLFCVSTRENP